SNATLILNGVATKYKSKKSSITGLQRKRNAASAPTRAPRSSAQCPTRVPANSPIRPRWLSSKGFVPSIPSEKAGVAPPDVQSATKPAGTHTSYFLGEYRGKSLDVAGGTSVRSHVNRTSSATTSRPPSDKPAASAPPMTTEVLI